MNKFLAGTAWIVLVGAVSYHFLSQYPRPPADADASEVESHIGRAQHGTLPTIIEFDFTKRKVKLVLPRSRPHEVGCDLRSRKALHKKVAAHGAKHHKHKAGAHHKHHPKPKHHGGHHHHHNGGHGAHHGGHTGGHHHHTPPPHHCT